MRTLADLLALGAGLAADLVRREGPIRRAPRRLLALLRRPRGRLRVDGPAMRRLDGGAGTDAADGVVRRGPVEVVVGLLIRSRDVTVHAVRTGIDRAARFGRRSLEGARPESGAATEAVSRAIASLARSVLALPGGPVEVVVGLLIRSRDVTVHAVRTGIDGAARFGRRSLQGARPESGAATEAVSRAIASLARSVLALPGGPVEVVVGLLVRSRDATVHAVRTGIDGAARFGRRSLEGARPESGAMIEAVSRGIASLARSVLALPGGPVPVAAGAVAVLALAGYAWTLPTESDQVQMRPFVVEYAFDYRADLPPNVVYESDELRFGDPVFLGVVDTVDVTVDWSVPRGDVVVSGGRLAVTTLLRSDAGWTRVLDRVDEVDVEGLRASSAVRLDLPAAIELARKVDEAAGVSSPVRLEVLVETLLDDAVAPSDDVDGGTPVDGYSSATLSFALDERVVRLIDVPVAAPRAADDPLAGILAGTGSASTETGDASTETGGASTESGGASTESGGASTETGSLSRFSQSGPGVVAADGRVGVRDVVQMFATDVLEPNHLRLGPLRLEVATARRNLTLLGLALLAAGVLGMRVLRRIEEYGEAAIIEARYGPILTPLPIGVNGHGAHAIDVGSFDALHALALDRDTPIMVDRAHRPGEVAHYLFDGPTTYRYVARGRSLAPTPVAQGVDIPLDDDGVAGVTVDTSGQPPAS